MLSAAGNGIGLSLPNRRFGGVAFTDAGSNESVTIGELTVSDVSKLPTFHKPGKVIRVRADRGGSSYYLKAVPTGPVNTTFSAVRWEECPRTYQPAPLNPMVVMAVANPQTGIGRVGISTHANTTAFLSYPSLTYDR